MCVLPSTLVLPAITQATAQRGGTWNDSVHPVTLNFETGGLGTLYKGLTQDGRGRFILRTVADWEKLVNLVQNNKGSYNVIMANDIDISGSEKMLGRSLNEYSGTFDGNGHTLTVNYDSVTIEYAAPFLQVKEATIRNLHVAGTVRSNMKFASGLIGVTVGSPSTVNIENCRVSATISSTIDGDASNGGFVGLSYSYLNVKDCLFDGQLMGDSCHSVGGYVGAIASGRKAKFTNCLFAPTELGTNINDCRTFIREAEVVNVTFDNCFYVTPYDGRKYDSQGRLVLYNSDDWDSFISLVQEAGGNKEVNAIMGADISTVYSAGFSSSVPYCGTFDGNGHTLTVKLEGGNNSFVAPFSATKNATIKNLTVRGSVRGGIHSSGLVGSSTGSTLNVYNCHVSTDVTISSTHAGGIIGHGHSVKNRIKNCIFDGTITATSFNVNSYAGSFIGWEDGGTSNEVWNNLENGTYTSFNHAGLNYINGGTCYGGTNNWHYKGWSEGNKASSLTPEQLASKLGTSEWYATGNVALTKQHISQVGQGLNGSDLTPKELSDTLGTGWTLMGSTPVPMMQTSTDAIYKSIVWDKRAKLVLNIDKKVGDEVRYTERYELSTEERDKGEVELNLNTSCVNHEFRFVVERDKSPLPLSVTDTIGTKAKKKESGAMAIYKFDNNVVLTEAKADTLQNAVSLSWTVGRGMADYYRIMRYDKLYPDSVVILEPSYTQTAYIDRTVRPQHNYVYTIEGVTQCEGNNTSTVTAEGCCTPTGMVRGYVRLANGIGLPGYTVTATPKGTIEGAEILTCITDSTGYFEIGGLIYQKYGEYTLKANDPNKEASFTSQIVTFDEDINLHTNIIFTQSNYYIFSGYVLYEGSSIPVSGVHFLRDGVEVVNSSGKPVTTNNQGAFEVSVPQGSHRIQVVKDGHVFKNDGFFITPDAEPDSTWHNWQKNVSEIYLWDETKVNLQGRVVGGNDQGLLPLGQSLSKNNLGEDITLVFQLEGDNTSWIVRDQLNSSVTERHERFVHGKEDNDTTCVDAYRHRIEIHPDPKTGEYMVPFYPVKYKVTEIYAKGYPTLFQTGMVSETVDLNDYVNGDTAVYSRIYHSQPTLDIWQFNGTQERYYGLKQYTALDNAGIRDTVVLWRDGKYTMGHPVFIAGNPVPMVLSAREEYHYNNEELGELDVVQLHGGLVRVNNGLVASDDSYEVELDSLGQGTYIFTPQNLTFTQEGDMALRTMQFTLLYDESYYDVPPVKGYVMASKAVPQGRRIVAGQNSHLVDILRDPPGSSSTAYIEKGSTMSYSYSADYTVTMGAEITLGLGKGSDYYTGIYVGGASNGTEAGSISSHDDIASLSYDLATSYYNDWEYNYEFTTNERIETSDGSRKIGADTDVYIGITEDVIVEDAIAVRVVPSATLERLMPRTGHITTVKGHEFEVSGTVKVLARGWDDVKKDSIYLIRDEVMQLSNKVSSCFVYSQSYLTDEVIPTLLRTRNALLLGADTDPDYAQALANNQKKPVYVSKVDVGDDNFALDGYYETYKPKGVTDNFPDEVQIVNTKILTWAGFIAANEKEKLEATDLVKVYDFDGRTSVSYSESFSTSSGAHRYWAIPSSASLTGDDGLGWDNKGGSTGKQNKMFEPTTATFKAGGVFFSIKMTPLFGFDFNYLNGKEEGYSKETGFTLACSSKSNLSVAVYHSNEPYNSDKQLQQLIDDDEIGIFYKNVEDNLKLIYNGRPGSSNTTSYLDNVGSTKRYRNFVFRTLGGATNSPWEDERRTAFYNPGTLLDQKTLEIDQLRIWAKESSVSNVPYGEPARFTIYMTNESDMPDRVTKGLKYYLEDEMNSKGAKVLIDGHPLTGSGLDLWLEPNTIIEKQVEVYAGAEFDYDDIGISFMNEEDLDRIKTVKLSAHFVPSAGKSSSKHRPIRETVLCYMKCAALSKRTKRRI